MILGVREQQGVTSRRAVCHCFGLYIQYSSWYQHRSYHDKTNLHQYSASSSHRTTRELQQSARQAYHRHSSQRFRQHRDCSVFLPVSTNSRSCLPLATPSRSPRHSSSQLSLINCRQTRKDALKVWYFGNEFAVSVDYDGRTLSCFFVHLTRILSMDEIDDHMRIIHGI